MKRARKSAAPASVPGATPWAPSSAPGGSRAVKAGVWSVGERYHWCGSLRPPAATSALIRDAAAEGAQASTKASLGAFVTMLTSIGETSPLESTYMVAAY